MPMQNIFLTIDASTIDWSRAQFALTAIYHWLLCRSRWAWPSSWA